MPMIRPDSEGNKPDEAKHLHLNHYRKLKLKLKFKEKKNKTYNSLFNLGYDLSPALEQTATPSGSCLFSTVKYLTEQPVYINLWHNRIPNCVKKFRL